MAGFDKKAMNGVGAALSAAVLVGAFTYGASPQLDVASEHQQSASEIESNIELNNLRLARLSAYADDPSELYQLHDEARESVPDNSDVPSIQRTIVDNLGAFDLNSFSHGPATAFTTPESPELSLEPLPEPFSVEGEDTGDSGDSSDDGESEESSAEVEAVPVEITISGGTIDELSDFLSSVEDDDRLILVRRAAFSVSSATDDEGNPISGSELVSATVHLYAFASE